MAASVTPRLTCAHANAIKNQSYSPSRDVAGTGRTRAVRSPARQIERLEREMASVHEKLDPFISQNRRTS